MSFILEALKKAEAERQRQTGPTLLEVRVTTPRRRFPLWTLIIGALLAVNILLLVIFGLRRPAASLTPAATAASPVAATPAAPVSAATVAAAAPMASTSAAPATATPVVPAAATPIIAAPARSAPVLAAAPSENPADFEPALPASDAGPDVGRAVGPGVSPGVGDRNRDSNTGNINTNSNSNRHSALPSLAEVADMPDLRLDLHVYSTRAADRYALITMHPVHEGDVLPEGPRVLTIDRDGVALSYRGSEFMLRPQ